MKLFAFHKFFFFDRKTDPTVSLSDDFSNKTPLDLFRSLCFIRENAPPRRIPERVKRSGKLQNTVNFIGETTEPEWSGTALAPLLDPLLSEVFEKGGDFSAALGRFDEVVFTRWGQGKLLIANACEVLSNETVFGRKK